jgi:predicted glycosyltransferase
MNTVYFDITHMAHINMFKHVIRSLIDSGNKVKVFALDRGRIIKVLKKELPGDVEIKKVLSWKPNTFYIIMFSNIMRFFCFLGIFLFKRPDIGISSGSISFSMALKLLNVKNYQFSDDPERELSTRLEIFSSTKKFYPPIKYSHPKVEHYNCLKQWAYLSPVYFTPVPEVLDHYGLEKRKYIFVRAISNKSLNYLLQKENNLPGKGLSELHNGYKVVLSLENKSERNLYPEEWILLEEPVMHIHSLLYYSALVISNGDTVAREASMLGVPSIYTGIRNMAVNDILLDKGLMVKAGQGDLMKLIDEALAKKDIDESQAKVREDLSREWDDLTDFILKKIKDINK